MKFSLIIILIIVLSCSEKNIQEQKKTLKHSVSRVVTNHFDKQCYLYDINNKNHRSTKNSSYNSKIEICFVRDSIAIAYDNIIFKAKYLRKNNGIYIDNILTHAFFSDSTINIPNKVRLEPIINKTTKLVGTKFYLIKNKKQKVLKYYEDFEENSHSLIVSYYLANGIPLIVSKYYLNTSFFVKNEKYLELVEAIVQDEKFFEIEDLQPPVIE